MKYLIMRDYSHTDSRQLFEALTRRVDDQDRTDLKAHVEMTLPQNAEALAKRIRKQKRHHRFRGQKVYVVAIIAEFDIHPDDGPKVWP